MILAAALLAQTLEKEILLEGGPSFDYVNVDSVAQRLYVGHAPCIDVVDLNKSETIGRVGGVDGAHGAIAVHEFNRGFATAGRKNKLIVFDLETLQTIREVATGENPDAVLYVASVKEVWTFNGKSKDVTCVDPATLQVKGTIKLNGKPEAAVDVADRGLVYVNLEDAGAICVIDAKRREALETHSVAPGSDPTGLAFDPNHGLLFAGCSNKKLVAIETATWKVAAVLAIGERCDGVAFDPKTRMVFASCRDQSGVVHVKDPKTFQARAPLETKGGKTCALDPQTHKLFIMSGPPRGEKGPVKILVFTQP